MCSHTKYIQFHTRHSPIFQSIFPFDKNCIVWTQKSNVESWIKTSFQNLLVSYIHQTEFYENDIVRTIKEINNCI